MEHHWDAFLEQYGAEAVDMSLREVLETFYHWLRERGVIPETDEPPDADDQPMFPAVLVTWTESERGWGQRPDGASLHLTRDDAKAFIQAYWDRMPARSQLGGDVPDEYSRPDNDGRTVMVDGPLRDHIAAAKDRRGVTLLNAELSALRRDGHLVIEGLARE